MKASEHNIEAFMTSIHEKIDSYSDYLTTKLDGGDSTKHVLTFRTMDLQVKK